MKKATEEPPMPAGKLALRVLSGSRFPASGRWTCRIHVLAGFASSTDSVVSQDVTSKSKGATPAFDGTCEFAVDWTQGGNRGQEARPEQTKSDDPALAKLDTILKQLGDQRSLLEAQSQELDEQAKRLDASESKVTRG